MRRVVSALFGGILVAVPLILASGEALQTQATTLVEISVGAGPHDREDVPVTANVAGIPLQSYAGSVQLYEVTDGTDVPVPSQLRPGQPDRLSWILSGRTPAESVRRFELRAEDGGADAAAAGYGVDVNDTGESLRVTVGGTPVLEYRYAPAEVPEGVDEVFSSSGYIHPLWSPQGEVLSRIQPPDHYHHYGIWNPWTRTEFEGRTVDFWNLGSGQGRVRADRVIERTSGEVFGGFKSLHDHVDYTGPTDERVALTEQWDVTVWQASSDAWLIDFVSTLNPATSEPLTIKGYRYQGFSLRATEKWNDETARLLTSEGFDKSNANSTRARWIDVNGVSDVESGTSGILFMTNPSNYNFPEHLRIWPVGANGGVENVYINFNPAQDRDWELAPGRTYALKYRMFVYDGEINAEQAERLWTDYADPPRVDVRVVGRLP